MTKKILILTLSLLTITLVSKAQVEIVSGGTSGAYTVAVPGTFVLTNGLQVTFKAHTANTAGATLSVSGTAAKNITKVGGSAVLSGSDILTNQVVTVAYDGTNWQMISALGSTPTAPTNYWSVNGTDIYNNNAGKVGIGKSTPSSTLDAAGDINSDDVYKLDGTTFLSNWNGNVLVGYTLATSLSGIYNTFIGEGAGQNTTTPARNTFLGRYAGNSNITGSDNTSLGAQAASNANSSYNTSIGAYSNTGITSGQYNTSLGYSTGQNNTIGSNNTFLGYNADASANNLTNATAIGYNAKVGQSNSLVLGGTGADIVNVGIGTVTPNERLHVVGDINVTNAIKLNGNSGTAGQVLTSGGGGGANTWSTPTAPTNYWSPNGSDIFNNNAGAVLVGGSNMDGAYKVSFGKDASSVEKVLSLTNSNNFVGGGTSLGFRSNFGGTMWDQALISGITGAASASGDLAFSVMKNRATSTMVEAMRIQGSTGNVGIGTSAPSEKLEVNGGQIYSIWANPNSIPNVMIRNWNSGSGPGYLNGTLGQVTIVTSDAAEDKYAIQGAAGGNSGNKYGVYGTSMGLGVNYGGRFSANGGSSNYALYAVGDAAGTSNGTGTFSTVGGSGSGTTYGIYGQNSSSSTGATYAGYFENFNSTGSIIYGVRSNLTGNAGGTVTKYGIRSDVIGTASSNVGGYFRAVGGTTNHAIQLVDGSEANNRVLASDAAGNATWTDLTALSSGSTAWTRVAPNIYPTTLTDKVGIGVATPTNKLDVEGAAVIGTTFSGTNTAPTNGLLVEGTVGIGTPSPGTYGLYSAVGTSTNKKTLTVSAFGASFVDNAPAVLEIRGGTNTVGAEVGVIDFINTSNGSIDYNFARISAHRENANATFASLRFYTRTGSTLNEAMRINENGKIGIGITDPVEILEIGSTDSDIELETYSTTESSSLHIKRGRGTLAIPTIPSSGDYYGGVGFQAWDGTAFQEGARIQGTVDGVVGATDMPGRLEFWTSPDGTATAVERMRITNSGNVGIGITPSYKLHVENLSTSNVALFTNTTTTGGVGIRADVSLNNATGAATRTGVYGTAWYGTGVNEGGHFYGYGGTTAYGIYAQAGGGTINWAGYFVGGDVYIQNTIGIGTTTPDLTMGLDLQIATGAYVANFENTTGAVGDDGIKISIGNVLPSTSAFYLGCYAAGGLDGGLRGDGAGGVGLYTASDRRLKENIIDLPDALSTLSKISAKQYEFKKAPGKKMYGFIAQDLLEIYPTAVAEPDGPDGIFMVNYASLTPLLTGGINELYKLVKEQQTQIDELRREVEALKNK